MEVDLTTMKFIDLARQMEAFFIQKRFLLSVLRPQLVLKEENLDLRWEINRKDEMIKKHYESIERWKNMLSDTQPQHMPHPSPQQPPIPPQVSSGKRECRFFNSFVVFVTCFVLFYSDGPNSTRWHATTCGNYGSWSNEYATSRSSRWAVTWKRHANARNANAGIIV